MCTWTRTLLITVGGDDKPIELPRTITQQHMRVYVCVYLRDFFKACKTKKQQTVNTTAAANEKARGNKIRVCVRASKQTVAAGLMVGSS